MIRSTVFTILLLTATGILSPGMAIQSPQPLFDRANDRLNAGEYRQALDLYRNLEEGNRQVSGSLFLNMGISYVQLDSLGMAKYYFLKARHFEDTQAQARQALEYVNARFSRQSAVLPKLPWQQFVEWLNRQLGATPILAIGILLLNLGVLLFVGHWFLTYRPRYLKISGLSLAAAGVLVILTSFYLQYVDRRYSEGVMVHKQANVYEKPDSTAAVVSQAYEGYTFTVDRDRSKVREGWNYVRMSNGMYGWINSGMIQIL